MRYGFYLNKAQSSRSTRRTQSPYVPCCVFNPIPTDHKMYRDVVGNFGSCALITCVLSLFCSSFIPQREQVIMYCLSDNVLAKLLSFFKKLWRLPQLAFTRRAYFMLTVFYRCLPFCNTKLHSSCGYSCSQIWNCYSKPNFCWRHCSKCEYGCNTVHLYHDHV